MRIAVALKVSSVATVSVALLCAQGREKRIAPVDGAARQSFEHQPKVAVLAGIGNYPSRSGLGLLHYRTHDVDLLQTELGRQGYKVVVLKDQEATRGSVRRALRDAGELVDRRSGTMLFFFSGHGFAENGTNYLATFEATSGELGASGLSVLQVQELLTATGAPRQVMFIDACRNEPGKGSGTRSFDRLTASAGLRVLFSTKAGRISYEDDQLGSGVFTHFLVRGLRGEAAGTDGLITFRDLADYVTDAVSGYGFERGQMQVPFEAGESSGDFLLARAAAGSPGASAAVASRTDSATLPPPIRLPSGTNKVNPKDGLTYIWIPGRTFTMGCSPGDSKCFESEKPAHQVTMTNGFWIGQTEVTQEAWQRVVGTNPSHFKGSRLPVENVSWNKARGYCQSVGMRLPTEAEWEYAARAESTQSRYGEIDQIAWHDGNSGGRTHEVAKKQPNGFGLYDMLGNVWEWVADWYGNYSSVPATDPQGAPAGEFRVVRGGAYSGDERASDRYRIVAEDSLTIIGLRCAGEMNSR